MHLFGIALLLFGVGIFAGILNVTAGGGSMITVPVLIFLGVDPLVANGTNRIGILVQNAFAVGSFKHQKRTDFKLSLKLSAAAVPGALLGALIAAHVSSNAFKMVLPAVLLFSGATLVIPPEKLDAFRFGQRSAWLQFLALFLIGVYGGFIQIGVGFLFMAGLRSLLAMDLVTVNVHKVTIVLFYTIPAFAIFLWSGQVNWLLGLFLAAGTATGGILGSRITIRGGERWIRAIAGFAVIAITIKLIIGLV